MLDTKQYGFVLPFEVVSMLLLAAMIGCIVIAMKAKPKEKGVPVEKQSVKELIIEPENTVTIPEELSMEEKTT